MIGLVVALVALAFGPILDHHFAERQLGHTHFGTANAISHVHSYAESFHAHTTGSTPENYPVALYKHDGSVGASTVAFTLNNDWASFALFEPTSVFVLPSESDNSAYGTSVAPLLNPPQSNL